MRIVPVNFFDRVADGDLTVTSAETTMPLSNLQSNVRDRVWRSTSDATQTIVGDWDGDTYPVNFFGLFGPASMAGVAVGLQLFDDVGATSLIYDSGAVAWPSFAASGWGDSAFGGTPWTGAAADQSPLVMYLAATYNAKSFKIFLVDVALPTAYFQLSRAWLGQYVDAPYKASAHGMTLGWVSNAEHRRTRGGTLRRLAAGGRWRELRFETVLHDEADRYKWMDLLAACDPGNEIVVSIFPGDGTTRQERDFTILGSLEALNPIAMEDYNIHRLRLAVVES